MKANALRWLGSLWVLPVAIPIWALYVLPFWLLLGWYERERPSLTRFAARFRVSSQAPAWLLRLWQGWAGHAMPFAIIVRPGSPLDTVRHERRHIDQWLLLGPLFVPVYLFRLVTVGYKDNELEADARRHAERGI